MSFVFEWLYRKFTHSDNIHSNNDCTSAFSWQPIHIQIEHQFWRQHHLHAIDIYIMQLVPNLYQFLMFGSDS